MGETTKGRARVRWNNVVGNIWKDLGGEQEEALPVCREFWRVQEEKERIEEREMLGLRNKVKEEKHLEIYGGLREDIGMKTYLHGPMDYAKKLKLP